MLRNSRFISSSSSSQNSKKIIKSLSLDAVIGKLVSANDYQQAVNTLLQHDQNITLSALKATLFVCEKNNQHQTGLDLAKKLDVEGRLSSLKWDEPALSTILRLQCHVGDLKGAELCLSMILSKHKEDSKNANDDDFTLKRRSVAPLIDAYYKRLSTSSSSSSSSSNNDQQHNTKSYYAQRAQFLYEECKKHKTELYVEDLDYFSQCFKENKNNNNNKLTIMGMIEDFVDHTPILGDVDGQGKPKDAQQCKRDVDHFENVIRIVEGEKFAACDDATTIIDSRTAICSKCNNTLDATPMSAKDLDQLKTDIETKLITHACNKNPRKENAIRAGFKAFQNYCSILKPDVLLDGANLGYYGLSSWYHIAKKEMLEEREKHKRIIVDGKDKSEASSSSSSFHQFDKKNMKSGVDVPVNLHFVNQALLEIESLGKKPLVVLHERHLEKRNLLPSYLPIVEEWMKKKRCVFATPSGLNDDICWLWAIVQASSVGQSCHVLTNDAMRDHHFALLSRRAFLRLRDRKQMKFSAKWTGDKTEIFLQPPPVYSSFIQKNNDKWHVPYYENVVDECGEAEDDRLIKWKCY